MEEREYYLAFSLVSGVGPKTFLSLLKYFKTAKKAWIADSMELKNAGFRDLTIKKIEEAKETVNVSLYISQFKHKNVSFIAFCDNEYPRLLKQIPNPPIVLFVKGEIKNINFEKTIGIVGTRKITNYGREVTKLFSSGLSLSGFTIASGMATGVDTVASLSAIEAGGKTIAVLGNGVDLCVPTTNESLYDKILDGNGIIVSEYPLGQGPTLGSFPSRNRIIAGLSLGVLVTEGAKDSGSLITADYAFKFQRKVFAVPGPITSSLSVAPLKLIEKGAHLVVSPDDILKEFKIQSPELIIRTRGKNASMPKPSGTKDERKILKLLENESLRFDEIVRKLQMDSSKAGSLLSLMEIKGLIKNTGEGTYRISD